MLQTFNTIFFLNERWLLADCLVYLERIRLIYLKCSFQRWSNVSTSGLSAVYILWTWFMKDMTKMVNLTDPGQLLMIRTTFCCTSTSKKIHLDLDLDWSGLVEKEIQSCNRFCKPFLVVDSMLQQKIITHVQICIYVYKKRALWFRLTKIFWQNMRQWWNKKKLWNNQVMILNNPMNRKPCNCAICPETHLVDLQAGKYIWFTSW